MLASKEGQEYSSLPQPVLELNGEQIDKVYTNGDTCYAMGYSNNFYVWGNLGLGLGLS
jgi:hypothetical protein